jgi:hypothetical protein
MKRSNEKAKAKAGESRASEAHKLSDFQCKSIFSVFTQIIMTPGNGRYKREKSKKKIQMNSALREGEALRSAQYQAWKSRRRLFELGHYGANVGDRAAVSSVL